MAGIVSCDGFASGAATAAASIDKAGSAAAPRRGKRQKTRQARRPGSAGLGFDMNPVR
ncbi:MAG TPA: hypothetical protein PKC23_08495 [Candidatus Desulfobacillus sp.]|nr:hypothetical protein [Candidatus Desulfobacillus sp.]